MAATSKRRQRTWSAFGDVRRLPSEYEIVTHGTNWTLREGRKAALEQNPSSPANLWFKTYRDLSPLQVERWDDFRDPSTMTYRKYVAIQDEQEQAVARVLDTYSDAGHDRSLPSAWLDTLRLLFTASRYPLHGAQQVQAYMGLMAPSSYITNAATFAAADLLRRVSLVAYRTKELDIAHPGRGFGQAERGTWQTHQVWQPTRELVETALVAYDWAEAFTAVNLVILPTLDDVLLRQLGEVARHVGDELTWLLLTNLRADSARRADWSAALAAFALAKRPANRAVLDKWIAKWSPRADVAASALAAVLDAHDPRHVSGAAVTQSAAARHAVLAKAGIGTADTAAAR